MHFRLQGSAHCECWCSLVAEPATASTCASAASGSRHYDPEADELAVLLLARVNGVPAIGADLARRARSQAGQAVRLVSDELPEDWQ